MSQLVRLEGKHTWQNAHCALCSAADGFHTKSIIAEMRIQPIIWFSSFGVWSSENFTFIYKSWIIIFVFVQWNNGLHQKKTRQWTKEQKLARLKILEETLANAARNALALLLWPMPAFSIFTDVFALKSLVGFTLTDYDKGKNISTY